MGGGAPDTPDYVGQAKEQGAQQLELLKQQTIANRPNQYNTTGSSTWSQDPTTGQWTQTQSLSPELQQLYNTQLGQQGQVQSILGGLLGGIQNSQGTDLSKYSQWADATSRDAATQALMDRMQPNLDRSQTALSSSLAAQGLTQGSEAWNNAMDSFNRQKNDAQLAAIIQGGTEQTNELNNIMKQYQLAAALKNSDLNTYLSLASGGQVSPNQSFGSFSQAGEGQATDLTGAMQAQYNSDLQNYNANKAQGQSIGAGVGSVAGSFFGPIGTAAGGALGGLLGGLF